MLSVTTPIHTLFNLFIALSIDWFLWIDMYIYIYLLKYKMTLLWKNLLFSLYEQS